MYIRETYAHTHIHKHTHTHTHLVAGGLKLRLEELFPVVCLDFLQVA
jgi:hypothetical protein